MTPAGYGKVFVKNLLLNWIKNPSERGSDFEWEQFPNKASELARINYIKHWSNTTADQEKLVAEVAFKEAVNLLNLHEL